ncbi:RNA-directed DNA polymerase from mobile element jockey [Araneus ventricosus]|uniref:RNA-directed DNA polymerase from mobile element jockey n=1 Tax=Araneus ventricosus TaxID=182803 RepID=A0A4Y2ETH5_ARAVE|nr:RNA-directed DNA polymerase from mobile element jockey [Araneus ventricosus]
MDHLPTLLLLNCTVFLTSHWLSLSLSKSSNFILHLNWTRPSSPTRQFGFRVHHSTVHQLLCVINSITQGMNNKFYTGGVFLDIQKAFDRMWHDGLIYKLIQLNFPKYLIHILRSFLENRTFKVIIHGKSSNTGVIKAGTPQGSVLSPISTLDVTFNSGLIIVYFSMYLS